MKRNKRNYKTTTSTELDYQRVIKISVGVLIVLVLVYLVTALASGEIKFNKKEEEKITEIQYEEILAGETFNRSANEYYVLFCNLSDNFTNYYLELIGTYKNKENSLPFYMVDIEKKANTDYVTNELKIENPTIIKIKDSKIVDTIKGKDNVLKFFN